MSRTQNAKVRREAAKAQHRIILQASFTSRSSDVWTVGSQQPSPQIRPRMMNLQGQLSCLYSPRVKHLFPDQASELSAEDAASSKAIRPFATAGVFVCLFKALGQCKRALQAFTNFQGLTAHCNQKHHGQIITSVVQDPLEDGTRKIPCRRACGKMFASYSATNYHATGTRCPAPISTRSLSSNSMCLSPLVSFSFL